MKVTSDPALPILRRTLELQSGWRIVNPPRSLAIAQLPENLKCVSGLRSKMSRAKRELARKMRQNPTAAEDVVWDRLGWLMRGFGKKAKGPRFHRQVLMRGWILDFYYPSRRLAVEIDGEYHLNPIQAQRDQLRDIVLERDCGIQTLRFRNAEVLDNEDWVIERIERALKRRPQFRTWNQALPKVCKAHPAESRVTAGLAEQPRPRNGGRP